MEITIGKFLYLVAANRRDCELLRPSGTHEMNVPFLKLYSIYVVYNITQFYFPK